MSDGGPGALFIVATPIGHLDDITMRALSSLREADLILAEDTRHTRKLCNHHGIHAPLSALHAHSSREAVTRYVTMLREGKRLALVSDAGTPMISDPGAALVQAARAQGIPITALPGASAVTTALCVAGVPFDSFRFVGFIARSGSKRRRALNAIAEAEEATVMFESPRRLVETLSDLSEVLEPQRRVAVCRELTKLHEEVVAGNLAELQAHFEAGTLGEVTLVIEGQHAPAEAETPTDDDLARIIQVRLSAGDSARDIARTVASQFGLKKRDVYAKVLALSGE